VSNGYDFNPFPDARAGGGILGSNQFNNSSYQEGDMFNMDRSSQQFADADLARELSDLTRAANRANTSFYTIDPRGLIGGPDLDEKVDPVEWGNYVRKSQDSLRVIAEETGGYAVVNQNDFDKALKRIDAETSDYYVIGYYSSNPDPTKRNRRVEVKSKRPNINVWARNSYSLKPTPKPKKRGALFRQLPTSKLQRPRNLPTTNSQSYRLAMGDRLGSWKLGFSWNLVLGPW
jgi:hypothetical protein